MSRIDDVGPTPLVGTERSEREATVVPWLDRGWKQWRSRNGCVIGVGCDESGGGVARRFNYRMYHAAW